jgi:ribose/xylose/arabinose/galactoside ABC-type transport system permease subunit
VSAADFGLRPDRRRTASADWLRAERSHPLVKLVTRVVVAQAGLAAAIGLSYSRRHLPSIIITLMLVVALLGLAAMTRSGTHAAWVFAIGFESAFVMFGLFRFFTSRYLGGTLFAITELGVLLHPAVARAFSASPVLREATEEALSDGATG